MNADEYIKQARRHYPSLPQDLIESVSVIGISQDKIRQNNKLRFEIIDYLEKNLDEIDLPLIRYIMQIETECADLELDGCDSTYFETVGQMLFCLGQLEDVQLLWNAKFADFDSSIRFDGSYFFGAGIDETITYLETTKIEDKDDILEYLKDSVDDVKPWLNEWRRRVYVRFGKTT